MSGDLRLRPRIGVQKLRTRIKEGLMRGEKTYGFRQGGDWYCSRTREKSEDLCIHGVAR